MITLPNLPYLIGDTYPDFSTNAVVVGLQIYLSGDYSAHSVRYWLSTGKYVTVKL